MKSRCSKRAEQRLRNAIMNLVDETDRAYAMGDIVADIKDQDRENTVFSGKVLGLILDIVGYKKLAEHVLGTELTEREYRVTVKVGGDSFGYELQQGQK